MRLAFGGMFGAAPFASIFWRTCITVVAFVALHEIGSGELIEQHIGGYAIRAMSAGQQEGDGATVLVGQGMDLGRATPRERPIAWFCSPFPPAAQR
jgi:hypothetical protein